jgi:hypothetical protein
MLFETSFETLYEKRKEITNKKQELQLEIKSVDKELYDIETKIKNKAIEENNKSDEEKLTKFRNYLLEHKISFERLNLCNPSNYRIKELYDIGSYWYPIFKLDTTQITEPTYYHCGEYRVESVPPPTNDLERFLYPHVVVYLQNEFPIIFKCNGDAYI